QFPEEINRQDPLLQEAYQRALMDGFERVKRARVMLLGHSGAGKTHLRKRLLGKKYDEDKDRITNGIETDYVLVKEGWNSDEAECHGPAISCLLAENTRKIHEEIRGSHAASSKPSEKQSDVNQEEMITVAPSLSHLTLEDENTLQAEGQTVVHASQVKGLGMSGFLHLRNVL
ncbi:uncharacterized protein LOC106167509, partial [Lingula anatina]|uniref:Uncharacterized protein LOC106167509 n=1 Tax=Lingula anatina TaxID=7574 RepID=A0A1S3IU79_LINAN